MNNNSVTDRNFIHLSEGHHIDIFPLEDADDNYFSNYQRYNFYQVLWLTDVQGDASYFLDFDEYTLKKDQILIIFPGQIDCLDVAGKKGYLYAIENNLFFDINTRLQSVFLDGYYGNIFLSADETTSRELRALTLLLKEEINGKNRFPLLRSYMEAFLFHLVSLFEQTEDFLSKKDTRVGKLMRLIDTYFMTQRETVFYAGRLNMTSKKLNMISIQGTGKTIKQHLQERLLLEAKKEIRLNVKSLKEIAFELGFNEAAYFTRFFKKHTSLTPGQFRDIR